MNKLLKISAISVLASCSMLNAADIAQMFENAKVSGELRSVYAGYKQEKAGESDTYATAFGGELKYELAELNGFSAAAAFRISHDIGALTGEEGKQNAELSSSDGEYTVLSEAYLNYKNGDFNFRGGRQVIDTPLADSDDIRMIPNTFEAYIATYELPNFIFMVGNLQDWQGVDAGLDDEWVKTGEDGTWFGSVTYTADNIEASAWYYNITKQLNAAYFDASYNYNINDDVSILGAAQYLSQSEISNSGEEASIYGLLAEFSAYDLGVSLAYNHSQKQSGKTSFSGFGGGTLFSNMDIMILDEITADRDSRAIVAGLSYEIGDLTLTYAYGDFDGDADSIGDKANVVEQDIGFEYSIIAGKLGVSGIYVISEDKESLDKTDFDWDRFQLMVAYSF
ncbi:MAG: OprD family outer membrane porin [Sulfurimonas sp.]|uniref:OprD family outer membrane porin n=1 Tax=Sulfurimonas sp. TaxID=2022749 RepID=UPI0026239069|nr:OprD family outer membrane porin [Sulfurimonas sp.]MCW8895776.1 OprD family outer membrane porin [Sulfurimonas sp.]MCW8954302.1 OprD family outer membrane porin [Sulfurimonas sp.]